MNIEIGEYIIIIAIIFCLPQSIIAILRTAFSPGIKFKYKNICMNFVAHYAKMYIYIG